MPAKQPVLYAVGDVHGELEMLRAVLDWVHADSVKHGLEAKLIFVGDLIDRGPKSRDVVKLVRDLGATVLMGNHEQMALHAHRSPLKKLDLAFWVDNGGDACQRSYGLPASDAGVVALRDDLRWMSHLPTIHYERRDLIFVHAGLMPGMHPEECSVSARLWVREEFLESPFDWGRLVVHGHSPTRGVPDVRKNRINIDTGGTFNGRLTVARWLPDQPAGAPTFFTTGIGEYDAAARV